MLTSPRPSKATRRRPKGEGDAPAQPAEMTDTEVEDDQQEENEDLTEELIDETNPFYTGKKADGAGVAADAAAKAAYKDTSDAASDILRRMLERRRGGRT